MENLIPVINRLQDAFALIENGSAPIDLPQIVVVGGQSSGKSSVLENIVGRDFLPRGTGIVTRRPLILQLHNIPLLKNESEEVDSEQEWGEFQHLKQKFYDFNQIREEIKKETDRLTGSNCGISAQPINLRIFSPHVLNLTLVDLPGITKVPVGDQPKDIEAQIRSMVMSFIEKPNTIILAVQPANVDLANSDALQLAQAVDPEGKRTIGVLTKLDLMDHGTDAMDMLQGKVIHLRLGFIGVVNRSQAAINENQRITQALKNERLFFENHPIYKKLGGKCGTQFLAQSLNKVLMNHIKNCLPELKAKVSQMLAQAQEEMKSYGDSIKGISQGALLLQIISSFSATYTEMIEGKLTDDHSTDQLYGGARVNYIFNEIFAKYLLTLKPLDGLTPFDIRTSISNATGPKAALFVPESAFELLVRRQLSRMREPSLQCVDLAFDELERIVHSIEINELHRFSNLRDALTEEATNLLRNCRVPTKELISNLINMELNFINTNHPDFKLDDIIAGVMKKRQPQSSGSEDLDNSRNQSSRGAVPQRSVPPSVGQQNRNAVPVVRTTTPPVQPPSAVPSQSPSFFNMFFNKPESKEERKASFSGREYSAPLKLDQVPTNISVKSIPQEKEFEIELLEGLLESYFNIVRKNIQDAVPKAIMFFLVSKSKQEMQNELIKQLYREQSFDNLLAESPDIVTRRENCRSQIEILQKVHTILNEIRDYSLIPHRVDH